MIASVGNLVIFISIHALLAESDPDWSGLIPLAREFLSTLSLRRATKKGSGKSTTLTNFYPRSPCGERQLKKIQKLWDAPISIHALLAESDLILSITLLITLLFLSTLSLRRATVHYDNYNLHCVISIHALLAESDHQKQKQA